MTVDSPDRRYLEVEPPRSLARSVIEGAWRFTLVSLGGFSVWAFAGRWTYRHVGEVGLYAATTVVFLGLAVWLLYPLLGGPSRVWRLCRMFVPAFLAYAVVWCVLWFAFGAGLGEWLGAFAGSLAFVAVASWSLGACRGMVRTSGVFFLAHSTGYFAGGWSMQVLLQSHQGGALTGLSGELVGILAKLAWGVAYGSGFGAGLGYLLHQTRVLSRSACGGPGLD